MVHLSIERVAQGVAEAYGCDCGVEIIRGYPVTVNDRAMALQVQKAAVQRLGEDRFVTVPQPSMGAEDFSYVLQKVPGAMMGLGARPADANDEMPPALHSNRMVLNEDVLHSGIAMHAAMAMAPSE